MCVSTIGSFSLFGKQMKNHGKLQVGSWFFGFSLIFDFSVILIIYKGNHFGDPPPSPPGPSAGAPPTGPLGGRPPPTGPLGGRPPPTGPLGGQHLLYQQTAYRFFRSSQAPSIKSCSN